MDDSRYMHRCRILLDREELHRKGEPPCHSFIPIRIGDEGVSVRIINCNVQDQTTGYSLIRVSDVDNSLEPGRIESSVGDCSIIKVRNGQYMAFVTNRACPLAKVVGDSGCILSSAVPITDSLIEWTIIGPTSGSIHVLLRSMKDAGYKFEMVCSENLETTPVLTPKQEMYFTAAWESGYYDVPKRVSLDQLAETLNCSKSTLNVTLRTAERNIFDYYINTDKARSRIPGR